MPVGKFTDPVENDAISGRSSRQAKRSSIVLPRAPVDGCTIISGQASWMPLRTSSYSAGSEAGSSSASRTCTWQTVAPASYASTAEITWLFGNNRNRGIVAGGRHRAGDCDGDDRWSRHVIASWEIDGIDG